MLLSKVTGFFRIQTIAQYFGATWQTDAFLTAFLIPECIYLFFTEGALSAALVPLFTDYFKNPNDEDAIEDGQVLLATLTILVWGVGSLLALGMYWYREDVAALLGPQFSSDTKLLTASLIAIICGYIPLGLLSGVYGGYLNSRGHFLSQTIGPLLLNIVTILGALFLSATMGIYALAWAVLLGGLLSLFANIVAVKVVGTRMIVCPEFGHEGLKKTLRLLVPVLGSLILVQMQICVERMMASNLMEGSISSLNFASKLLNLPAGLLALTTVTALLPVLSESMATGNEEKFLTMTVHSHRVLIVLVTPLALLLSLFSTEIVVVVFQRGAFTLEQALTTGRVLFFYGLTLIPLTGTFLLTRAFFAQNNTKTPALVKMATITANMLFLFVSIEPFGIVAVPGAFLAMYLLNYLILLILFERQNPSTRGKMVTALAKTFGGALVAGTISYGLLSFQGGQPSYEVSAMLCRGITGTAVLFLIYGGILRLCAIDFFNSLKRLRQ